jgi:hypothetical protein
MLRKLGAIERMLTISSEQTPINVVASLLLEPGPAPEAVRAALDQLQARHPLLRARITKVEGAYAFFEGTPEIPLAVHPGGEDSGWESQVTGLLNTPMDVQRGPLMACHYQWDGEKRGNLMLVFHHSIMDGVSGQALIHELLEICAGDSSPGAPRRIIPPAEDFFPPAFQGFSRAWKTVGFLGRQILEEFAFRIRNRGKQGGRVARGGQGKILVAQLTPTLSAALSQESRRRKVTLNSILNAAMLQAVVQVRYANAHQVYQTFTFADLRTQAVPQPADADLGSFVSMMRFALPAGGSRPFWQLVDQIHAQIYQAMKRGDKYIAGMMSENLVKMVIRLDKIRLGTTALSYTGVFPLPVQIGPIRVREFHGFINNNAYGPEFTAQARWFVDRIWVDALYVDTDMDAAEAEKILAAMVQILESAVEVA